MKPRSYFSLQPRLHLPSTRSGWSHGQAGSSRRALATGLILASGLVAATRCDAVVNFSLTIERQSVGASSFYTAEPKLVESPETANYIWTRSGDFQNGAEVNNPFQGGADGSFGASMATGTELLGSLESSPWELQVNDGSGLRVFNFLVDLSGISPSLDVLPLVTLQGLSNGAIGVSTTPTFQWTVDLEGHTSFSGPMITLSESDGGSGFTVVETVSLGTGVTSWSPSSALAPNRQHFLELTYTSNPTFSTTPISDPVREVSPGVFETYEGWGATTITLNSRTSALFTTTTTAAVPEPAWTVAGVALALGGFAGWRRSRRNA